MTAACTVEAGSATWNLNPTNNDWNTAANWTPSTIPNTQADMATFGASNITSLTVGEWSDGSGQTDTMVHGIVFAPGAASYTITVTPVFDVVFPSILEIYKGGVTNNSGVVQNFVATHSGTDKASARIIFNSSASAGENVVYTNEGGASAGGDGFYGAFTSFDYSSTAAKATFVNNGGSVSGAEGGVTLLLFASGGQTPIPPDVGAAILGSTEQGEKPDAARLADISLAFFAKGHDPKVWLYGWSARAARLQQAALRRTAASDWQTAGTAEILVVQADEDPVAPISNALALQARAPDRVKIVNLRHASHAMLPEQPKALAALTNAFLAGETDQTRLQAILDKAVVVPIDAR